LYAAQKKQQSLCAAALHKPKCLQKSKTVQVRYHCHVMRQAESSRALAYMYMAFNYQEML